MNAPEHHVPVLFYLFALAAVATFVYNLRPLLTVRSGKADPNLSLNWGAQIRNGLLLGVGQRRVMNRRFGYATLMHFLLGWGFIELLFATTVDFLVVRGWFTAYLPEKDTPWFAALNDTGGLMLFAGLLMALYRRHLSKPAVLPQNSLRGRGQLLGDSGILLFLLLLVIGGFLSEAARLSVETPATAAYSYVGLSLSQLASSATWTAWQPALWWSHALFCLLFIALLPATKLFHVPAAILNTALSNRQRLGRSPAMHVSELMDDPEADLDSLSLGASKSSDFTWKQLLDTVSCTECARCTSVCPAHSSGRPLSPMKLIGDIRGDLYQRTLGRGEEAELLGSRITDDELWSCTTCGACSGVCPVAIDHVPTFTEMRRHLVMSEGRPPEQASERLEAMLDKGNPWGFPARDRTRWATEAGLELPLMKQKKQADVLYWVGCAGAYDARNQEVARAMVRLLEAAGVDYAVLGDEESCSGDSARRLGDEFMYESLVTQNVETLNRYDFNRIVTPCPHCFHTLANEYPDFGGRYRVEHHSQFIADLLKSGRLAVNGAADNITYHDPCYLGRHNQEYDAPREVLRAVSGGASLREMPQSRENSFCCGAGGGNMWYDLEHGERINVERHRQASATGAKSVAVSCSFCLIMLEDASAMAGETKGMKVRDIAELVADNLEA